MLLLLSSSLFLFNKKYSNWYNNSVLLYGVSPDDGVPEMIEIKGYPKFLMGVQWHPEFLATKYDEKLIKSFCDAVEKDK